MDLFWTLSIVDCLAPLQIQTLPSNF